MRLTTSQIFQIGNLALTYAFALALLKFDPTLVGIVSAATLTFWNGVGANLTGPQAQAAAVAAHIDQPEIKTIVAPAVANLEGVSGLIINGDADEALQKLANSTASINAKITK